MSRRAAIPLAAGLAAAAVAFAVVLVATRGGATTTANTPTTAAAAPTRGRLVFAQMGCGGCHALAAAGSNGGIGPSLDDALGHHTRGSLRAKISDPGTGGVMPQDFARRMSAADLAALVSFLMAARGAS